MTTLRVDPGDPDPDAIGLAASALAAGRLVVVPTDSVYGIAADPALPTAVGRLFEAKGRPRSLPIAVLAGTLLHVERLVELQGTARELAVARWPGPLTLVLRRKAGVDWDLGDTGATLAVRLPDHPVALALLTQTGPLAVTSANRTGDPTPDSCRAIEAIFGDLVSVYLDGGPSPGGVPSTVLDLSGEEPRVVREGALSSASLLEATVSGPPSTSDR